ncbi:MAG: FKBP-type peptidyl-prolyl cis-trans isomerase [Candidatus Rokuibacteriota bacterium]
MAPVIENDSLVELAYTLKDGFGAVLESSDAGPSFTYVHGRHQLLEGLEHALDGMAVGDETDVTLPPDEAYGAVDPTAFMEVGKYRLPPEALVPGTTLTARRSSGETMFVSVEEVRDDDTVVINMNHPLAGKTLYFHLRVLTIVPQPR